MKIAMFFSRLNDVQSEFVFYQLSPHRVEYQCCRSLQVPFCGLVRMLYFLFTLHHPGCLFIGEAYILEFTIVM